MNHPSHTSTASRVGHSRFTFNSSLDPYVLLEPTRASVMGSADPSKVTFPLGSIHIDSTAREVSGHNPERQDFIIGPNKAPKFAGYFVARFDQPFVSVGVARNTTLSARDGEGQTDGEGALLSGYVRFPNGTTQVIVRVGVSFISVDQARANIDNEIPDGQALGQTAYNTRKAWKDKLELIEIERATKENLTTFYTTLFHTIQVRYVIPCFFFLLH